MFEPLQTMLVALWSHDVSQAFAIIIAACFAIASLSYLPAFRRFRGFAGVAPGLMTSLGILGTFVGIFLGLLDFDIRTVNTSLPTLLEGLKVAFGTSILGLAAAVLFRGGSVLFVRDPTANEDVGIEDIVAGLDRLDKGVSESNRLASAGFDRLGKALSDDNDTSIVGQLQRLRSGVADVEGGMRRGFEAQIDEFKRFAEHMSAAFSEAIIKELQAVIREFNEKLSEQFGDNFKQLNEAVGRLVQWQDEYRGQMEELKAAFDNAVAGIQASREALGGIEAAAANIPAHLDAMEQSNRALNDQIETVTKSLGGFAEMREKAVAAFPEIQRNIDNMTDNLRESVEEQTQAVSAIARRCEEIVSSQAESAEAFALHVDGAAAAMQTAVENVTEASANAIAEHRQAQNEMLTGLQSSFNETIQGATTAFAQNLTGATVAMQTAVENVTEASVNAIAEHRQAQDEMLNGLQSSFNETIQGATTAFAQNVKGATVAMQTAVENVTEASANAIAEHRQAQNEMLTGLQSSFNETIQGATTRMNEAIGQLDQAIQDEIGAVVQTMAQNLSGMAQRFVDDYQPLLDATKDVVELGRRATRDEHRPGR